MVQWSASMISIEKMIRIYRIANQMPLYTRYFTLLFILIYIGVGQAQIYELGASRSTEDIRQGHIKVEPHEYAPFQFGVNSTYFTKELKPWYTVLGSSTTSDILMNTGKRKFLN